MVWVTAGGCGGGGGGGNGRGESGKHWGMRGRFRREKSSRSGNERGVKKDGGAVVEVVEVQECFRANRKMGPTTRCSPSYSGQVVNAK